MSPIFFKLTWKAFQKWKLREINKREMSLELDFLVEKTEIKVKTIIYFII